MLDGSIVLAACEIGGSIFVRDQLDDGAWGELYELPRDSVVAEIIPPELVARYDGVVRDPLDR